MLLLALMLYSTLACPEGREVREPLRIALTPVFLDDRVDFLEHWRAYLEKHLRQPVRFIQRKTYREVTWLLLRNEVGAAWICGFPYVVNDKRLSLLAVPLYHGKPFYRSYLITARDNASVNSWRDLEGKVFAFSDPDSNSGYLYPVYHLRRLGLDPATLFRKSFFAWAHRNVVEAVAEGLADAGAVDGYVWESLRKQNPELTGRTRVVSRSPEFGFPPFVVRRNLPDQEIEHLRSALFSMQHDPVGRSLLDKLDLDGFTRGNDALYGGIRQMAEEVGSP